MTEPASLEIREIQGLRISCRRITLVNPPHDA